jgi:hypothetical protein
MRRTRELASLALLFAAVAVHPAAADDSTRTKQLRLLCVQLSGDLTEPGGIAAFRRCLTAHDPLAEAARQNNVGHIGGMRGFTDRPNAAPPRGFGRDTRKAVAQAIDQFQIAGGKVIYAVATDGRLWRSTIGANDAKPIDKSVAAFQIAGDGSVFVLGKDDALWREGSPRVLIDQSVADFVALDAHTIYVRGTNNRLWRESGDYTHRTPVDNNVVAFQPISGNIVYVLSSDGKLWRETGDANNRKLAASAVKAFQYVPDGDTLYVLTTSNQLWRQAGGKAQEVDHDVAAFHAADMNLVYVQGTDGRLWKILGTRDQAVLIDRDMMGGKAIAFQVPDAGHVFVLDANHHIWAETMPAGR